MLKFVILLSAISCALGASVPSGLLPQLDGRIVGGDDTTIDEFPWQISLQRNGRHSCGGSIYSENIIITAAHCVRNVNATVLRIRAGSSYWGTGGVVVAVAAIRVHQGYSPSTMVNDIAILRLKDSLSFSDDIQPISLATTPPSNGAAAVVSGWGTTSYGGSISALLQSVNVNIVSERTCASSAYGYGGSIRRTMICAYANDKDACQGDSGGPLVSGGLLVGIVSWGYGCAYANYPGVYSNVASLSDWVLDNVSSI